MEKRYDRGSAVLVEVEFKKRLPFGAEVAFDPTVSEIEVIDAKGNEKVQASLIKKDTGRYYYIIQTNEEWDVGSYKVQIISSDGSAVDKTVNYTAFRLV